MSHRRRESEPTFQHWLSHPATFPSSPQYSNCTHHSKKCSRRKQKHTNTRAHAHTHTHTNTRKTHTCTDTHTHRRTNIDQLIHAHKHTITLTRIHTHTHTHNHDETSSIYYTRYGNVTERKMWNRCWYQYVSVHAECTYRSSHAIGFLISFRKYVHALIS